MGWLDEIEKQYRIHKKILHTLSGLSVVMLVVLYFYSKSRQSQLSEHE